jgi:hypothetical protein
MVWRDGFAENIALRYDADEKFSNYTRRLQARAAGSMTTTVEDLATFTSALLKGRILDAKTKRAMLKAEVTTPFRHHFPTLSDELGGEGAAGGLACGLS